MQPEAVRLDTANCRRYDGLFFRIKMSKWQNNCTSDITLKNLSDQILEMKTEFEETCQEPIKNCVMGPESLCKLLSELSESQTEENKTELYSSPEGQSFYLSTIGLQVSVNRNIGEGLIYLSSPDGYGLTKQLDIPFISLDLDPSWGTMPSRHFGVSAGPTKEELEKRRSVKVKNLVKNLIKDLEESDE